MLFNSQVFICGFLPVVLGLYYALAGRRIARQLLIVAASLVFYGWWDVRFVPLLVSLTLANWLIARWYGVSRAAVHPAAGRGDQSRRAGAVQIRRFPARHVLRRAGRELDTLAPDPAARHQLLRVPEDLLPDRPAARRPAHLRAAGFLHVRDVLSATHCRTDRAAQRDHPAIRRRSASAKNVGEPVARLCAVRHRRRQESGCSPTRWRWSPIRCSIRRRARR